MEKTMPVKDETKNLPRKGNLPKKIEIGAGLDSYFEYILKVIF